MLTDPTQMWLLRVEAVIKHLRDYNYSDVKTGWIWFGLKGFTGIFDVYGCWWVCWMPQTGTYTFGRHTFFRCLDPFRHSLSYGQSHLHYLLVHFHSHIILEFVSLLLQQNHHKCQVIRKHERWRWCVVIWQSWFSIILLRFLICALNLETSCCLTVSIWQQPSCTQLLVKFTICLLKQTLQLARDMIFLFPF